MVLLEAEGIGKLQRSKGKKECEIFNKLQIVYYGWKVGGGKKTREVSRSQYL